MKYRGPLAKPLPEKKSPKRIRSRRPETAKQDREYNARVKAWLIGKYCAVSIALNHIDRRVHILPATQCHHKHGRGWRRELLMIEALWVPVSDWGHQWIDSHREEARALGLLAPKGQYNELPPELRGYE